MPFTEEQMEKLREFDPEMFDSAEKDRVLIAEKDKSIEKLLKAKQNVKDHEFAEKLDKVLGEKLDEKLSAFKVDDKKVVEKDEALNALQKQMEELRGMYEQEAAEKQQLTAMQKRDAMFAELVKGRTDLVDGATDILQNLLGSKATVNEELGGLVIDGKPLDKDFIDSFLKSRPLFVKKDDPGGTPPVGNGSAIGGDLAALKKRFSELNAKETLTPKEVLEMSQVATEIKKAPEGD